MDTTGTASARMQAQCMEKLLNGITMTVNKLAKPARKLTWELDPVEEAGGVGEDGDAVLGSATGQNGDIVANKVAPMALKAKVGELNEAAVPVITGKQVALAVQSKALTHVVTNYDAVVTGKLMLGNPVVETDALDGLDLFKTELATLEPTSSERVHLRKAKDWAKFQKEMKAIHAHKAAEEAAKAARIAKAKALDGERFVTEQAEQDAEKEWEVIDSFDAIEKFEEITEQDAVEKYVFVELTPARKTNVRRPCRKTRIF